MVVCVSFLSCSPPPPGQCGGLVCTDEEYCREASKTCEPDLRPVVSISATDDVVTDAATLITGSIVDDVGVLSALVFTSETSGLELALGNDGEFSARVPVPLLDAEPFGIIVEAQDRLGATRASVQVIVDRVGPGIERVSPSSDDVAAGPTVEVTVKATDGSGALSVLSVGGQSVPSPMSGQPFTLSLTVPQGLNREPMVVPVVASDTRGNTTQVELEVLVDNVGPVIDLTVPAVGAPPFTTATLTAVAAIVDPSPVTVDFQLGSAAPVRATLQSPGVWSAELPVPLVEADDAVSVVATDALGNRSIVSRPVRIDRVVPVVNVSAPAADSIHRADLAVSLTTHADVTAVTAAFEIGTPEPLVTNGTTWSGTLPVPGADFTARTITFTATDGAGNVGTATVAVKTDTVAPVVTVTAPAFEQKFKASDFAAGNAVTVTWTVADADPAAETTRFDGAPFTGTTRTVTTSSADNGTTYTRVIVATDSAGNSTSATARFSVDRVPPTIVGWTPATGTRNLVDGGTVLTFSEPVYGPGANDAPIDIAGQPTPGGTWNAAHSEFTLPLSSFVYRVLDLSTAVAFTDAHGNPIPAQTRRLHTATSLPAGSLLTGVSSFSAASDADGVLSVFAVQPTGCSGSCVGFGPGRLFRDSGGTLSPVVSNFDSNTSEGALNVWNTVNASTLVSTPSYGLLISRPSGPIQAWPGGTANLPSGATGAVVSSPPLYREPSPASNLYASVTGPMYRRGTYELSLSFSPTGLVSVSGSHVSMFETSPSIRFARMWCGRNFPSGNTCATNDYTVSSSSSAAHVVVASTRSGSCEAVSYTSGSERRYAVLPKPAHENPEDVVLIPGPQTLTSVAAPSYARNVRFGRYTWGSEDVIVYTDVETTNGVMSLTRVRKMQGCGISSTDPVVGSIQTLFTSVDAVPVQVGSRVGLVWLADGAVKLVYPTP